MNMPPYRSLKFWEEVRDEICEIIHGIQLTVNTWDMQGNEVGAYAEILYGDTGRCELQMSFANTAEGTAKVILENCDDLPGTFKKSELSEYLCLACNGDGCDICGDGTMTAEQAQDYADSIDDPI